MDRKLFSKSAPSIGRRGSKEKTKKLTTMREINSWIVKSDNSNIKGSRNVGMLTENVTEQRLLYTRQLELGRERYKFLASHSYEKQKFMELQNRKTKSMKKMMQNARRIIETSHAKPETPRRTITVRIPQMEELEVNEKAAVEESVPKVETRPASKLEIRSASRLGRAPEERPPSKGQDGKKTLQFPKPIHSGKKPILSGRALYMDLSGASRDGKPGEVDKQVERLPSLSLKQTNRSLPFNSRIDSAASRKSEKNSASNKSKPKPASVETTESAQQEVADERVAKWRLRTRNKIPQFGQKFNSSVGDPRYVALTNTLVPCDDLGKPVISVEDIIAKKEILRGESKCEQNSRAKQLHARFIAYLLEQELKK